LESQLERMMVSSQDRERHDIIWYIFYVN
jgi:hypothetical protein